jgi:hypothetical protein
MPSQTREVREWDLDLNEHISYKAQMNLTVIVGDADGQ